MSQGEVSLINTEIIGKGEAVEDSLNVINVFTPTIIRQYEYALEKVPKTPGYWILDRPDLIQNDNIPMPYDKVRPEFEGLENKNLIITPFGFAVIDMGSNTDEHSIYYLLNNAQTTDRRQKLAEVFERVDSVLQDEFSTSKADDQLKMLRYGTDKIRINNEDEKASPITIELVGPDDFNLTDPNSDFNRLFNLMDIVNRTEKDLDNHARVNPDQLKELIKIRTAANPISPQDMLKMTSRAE